MSFADHVAADARLCILQSLEADPGYDLNEHVLAAALDEVGHSLSRDRLRGELAWLAEQGLATVTAVSGVHVVRLTARGADAALGRARVPGVARPRPE
jgi:DNA-binding GntR family transcriptional regulator